MLYFGLGNSAGIIVSVRVAKRGSVQLTAQSGAPPHHCAWAMDGTTRAERVEIFMFSRYT